MKLGCFFVGLFYVCSVLQAQNDSVSQKRYEQINWVSYNNQGRETPLWKKAIVPFGLMGLALSVNHFPLKTTLQDRIQKPFKTTGTHSEDYLQYMPIVELYAADLCKFKARNSVWNQTKYLAISELVSSGLVQILKYSLKIERPDHSAFNSFPSGHTTQAFVANQVLFNEYAQSNPVIACSGFLFSAATGTLRIIHNKHWVPDVLMGASIGILVTNLVYYFKPLERWNPWRSKGIPLGFVPVIGDQYLGFYASYRFSKQ